MTENTQTPTLAERDAHTIGRLKSAAGIALLGLAGLSFALGSVALYEAGSAWVGLPGPVLPALVPGMVDLGIVLLSIASMAARAERVPTWPSNVGIGVLVALSMTVQVAHVLTGAATGPQAWIGAALGAVAPALVWLSSSTFERLRFGEVVNREARRAAPRIRKTAPAPVKTAPTQAATMAAPPAPGTRNKTAARAQAQQLRAQGMSVNAISKEVGFSRPTVTNWLQQTEAPA